MEFLEKAKELGVQVAQFAPNCPLHTLPEKELETLIQKAHEWEIDIEVAAAGLEKENLARQLDLAVRVGSPLVRTLLEIGGKRAPASDCYAPLKAILPVCEKKGIKLAIENVHTPADQLRKMLDEFNHPLLGIVLDTTNNFAVSEGYKFVAERLAPYVMGLHYKDYIIRRMWHWMGFTCVGVPAGRGDVDPKWLREILKTSKHDYNVVLEQWPLEHPDLEETIRTEQSWGPQSVAFLRKYVDLK